MKLLGRRMFGDYTINKRLGQGGMGAVYLAKHQSIDQSVAIKVLHPDNAEDLELVKRFNREARAIARLTHPNIIRVFLFGHTEDGLLYLVMEVVEGRSLREVLERSGQLSELRAIYIIKQVLAALSEAHHLGIVHRDLKPDNILLTEYRGKPDFVKVVDFGIAKVREPEGVNQEKLTQAGVVYGTPEYLSPEQAQAAEVDGRADLYSVGVILREMVTSRVPFQGSTAMSILVQHVYDEPPDPRQTNPALSEGICHIISKSLKKNPEERFRSAGEFLAFLTDLEHQLRQNQLETGDLAYDSLTKTQVWIPDRPVELDTGRSRSRSGSSRGVSQGAPEVSGHPVLAENPRQSHHLRQIVIASIIVGLALLVAMALAVIFLLRTGQ